MATLLATLAPDVAAGPRSGSELAVAELGWPTTTRSASVSKAIDIMRERGGSRRYGRLAAGTRVAWKRIVASRDRCRAWLELEPRGWVCAKDVTPSELPPAAADRAHPERIVDDTLARRYLNVDPDGALAFASVHALKRKRPARRVDGWTFLQRRIDAITIAHGELFLKTIRGYIAARELVTQQPSSFAGVELTPRTPWPLAWVVPGVRPREATPHEPPKVVVRAAPASSAAVVRELEVRTQVGVLEQREGFVRIGEAEWVALADLRIAGPAKRPRGVRADERWIDVDLDHNTLVAYEGDTPVFATLVSTGFGSTPPSLHRITKKNALRTMANPAIALGTWSFPDVPFVLEFRKHYALHSVYWHDGFGNRRGHGCVNLSPRDARRLYDWTLPHVPAGWSQGDARADEGTPIRIRNRKHPDPPWMKWDSPPPVKTRVVEAR